MTHWFRATPQEAPAAGDLAARTGSGRLERFIGAGSLLDHLPRRLYEAAATSETSISELLLSRDRERFRLRNMAHWKIVLNWIAASVAVIAALLWFRSATVKIPANPPPRDENGMFAAQTGE
jgi:hypothetical protein